MVLIPAVLLSLLWSKKQLAGHKLKYCAAQTPNISVLAVFASNDNFRASVVSRLDHAREMFIDVACVSHVDYLHLEVFHFFDCSHIYWLHGLHRLEPVDITPKIALRGDPHKAFLSEAGLSPEDVLWDRLLLFL